MNKLLLGLIFIIASIAPSISFAGIPLFFQTGDELFVIEGGPSFDDGYALGYACSRLGLFGADIWTWKCDLAAVNLSKFSVGDLDPEFKAEMSNKYSLNNRKRDIWNHYGIFALLLLFGGSIVFKNK